MDQRGKRIRLVLAFSAIYVLWGATFLAIRIAVLQIPPLFTAGSRFFIAGVVLHGVERLRGAPNPTPVEWRNLSVIGLCMFVATYGPLFWAEQFVSSSVTSVIEATLPITTIVLEVFVFRRQRFEWRLLGAVLLGFMGVLLLLVQNHDQYAPPLPCAVILCAGVAWSLGAVLTRQLALPSSRPLTAGTAMLLGGSVLLVLSAVSGELQPLPRFTASAALALLYLIVGGSLVAYTAYVWLLGRMSATRVASHAYVNPVVAITLGYFAAGEAVSGRTLVASALILCSVYLLLSKSDRPLHTGAPQSKELQNHGE
jgi:drug/metabolite transporter (DMT)-like permease